MFKFYKVYYLIFLATLISSCQKKFGDFYDRPEGLGAPIFQQLEERGDFKELTAVIEKAGYKQILSETGWWTFFAPTDEAFKKFYEENNISGVNEISDSLATSIVKYLLVYNSYREDQLSTFQTGADNVIGEGLAYKRKTAYYDWVDQDGDGVKNKTIATNRNFGFSKSGSTYLTIANYLNGDNNNKYIPYFTTSFFNKNALSNTDYQAFFPNTTFSGFNVAGATVDALNKNIAAENGTIHVIDKVITPLKNIDQYIRSSPNYSEFAKLLDSLVYYSANAFITNKNSIITGSSDSVYVKGYNGRLGFSPNNENFGPITSSQNGGFSMILPTNAALSAYRSKILAKYGNTFFGATPSSVLIDFMNAHMWGSTLWPSQFKLISNILEEEASLEFTDITDKQFLSNGIVYGTNKVNEANVFRTVYGVPYLDPQLNLSYNGYNEPGFSLKGYSIRTYERQTILLMPDDLLRNNGWTYNESQASPWGFKAATATSYNYNTVHRENITRIFATGVLITPTAEINNFSGEGIVETRSGDYIKYKNGVISTSGSEDEGIEIKVTKTDNSSINGVAHVIDNMLKFTENNIGYHLEKLALAYPAQYSSFFWVLRNTTGLYNATTKAISGVNIGIDNKYTIFAPTNAAISEAVKAGLLPGNVSTGALPTATPTNQIQLDLMRKFVLYHIINGETVAIDGKKSDTFLTMLQNEDGSPTLINVGNSPTKILVEGKTLVGSAGSAGTNYEYSNQLSNRCLIHSIDNYLNYEN
jgi:uncharacterized surface protein with fasciclin (FAS1) repeats